MPQVLDSAADGVDYSVRDGIAIVTLNRPPANAFSAGMYRALTRVADHIANDESVRVAILTAASPKIFCGGADVKELRDLDDAGRVAFSHASETAARRFTEIPVPVIAAITGTCAGAGVAYIARCDYRISADHAKFTLPEINLGFVLEGGRNLIAVGVPSGALRMMLFSGRAYSADEVRAMHLVDEVVPVDHVMEVAFAHAGVLGAKTREALVTMKRAINRMSYLPEWTDDVEGTAATAI